MVQIEVYCLSDCANTGCAKKVSAQFKDAAEVMNTTIVVRDLSKTCSGYMPPKDKKDE